MNNPQSVGEQILQLQNIAYVKQFMQKLSVKFLFLVSLLLAVFNSLIIILYKKYYSSIINTVMTTFGGLTPGSEEAEDFNMISNLIGGAINIFAVIVFLVSLILPITLLYIIIRSASENPSVIPLRSVKLLYIFSFVQTIIFIVLAVALVIYPSIVTFAEADIISALIMLAITLIPAIIIILYFVFQTKFLGAVKHSATGTSLIYGTSSGFGVISVICSIFYGIYSALYVIFGIITHSLISSNDLFNNEFYQMFNETGLIDILKSMQYIFAIHLVIAILYTIYHATMASVAFSYKGIIATAIKESFATTKRQTVTVNSAFRTYGGQNSLKNYNYSASSGASQQSYAEIHKNITNNQNSSNSADATPSTTPEANPYEANPYNTYQGSPVIPEYNGSFPQNNNFDYPQQASYNNFQNNTPVQTGGSFGFQQDTSTNPYNE